MLIALATPVGLAMLIALAMLIGLATPVALATLIALATPVALTKPIAGIMVSTLFYVGTILRKSSISGLNI